MLPNSLMDAACDGIEAKGNKELKLWGFKKCEIKKVMCIGNKIETTINTPEGLKVVVVKFSIAARL